jgi:putative DNA primase/helicase
MSGLRHFAQALGGDIAGASILCPGPGHSPRDRSMQVLLSSTAPDGFVVRSFAGDPWQDCRDHIRSRLGISQPTVSVAHTTVQRARDEVEHDVPRAREGRDGKSYSPPALPADNTARAVALWNNAGDPRGTRVERYLKRRGLSLPDDIAGRVARYHESCPWGAERRPAMLTAFRLVTTDRLVAVHRTLISDDGLKIDRRMLGPVAGAAIKIDDDTDVQQGLAICEGFETGLAGRELGFRPVWALGSAAAIGAFPVLSAIDGLTILAETDDSGANAKATKVCGNRWTAADREVIIATPRVVGDMNDALQS